MSDFKFEFKKGRASTNMPYLRPNVEKYNLFVDYYFSHRHHRDLSHFTPVLWSSFPHKDTWDVDVKLLGKVREKDYEKLSDFMTDLQQFCLDSRFILDIYAWDTDLTIEDIRKIAMKFNSNVSKYRAYGQGSDMFNGQDLYYDHLTCELNGKVISDLSKRHGNKVKKVSKDLWRVTLPEIGAHKWIEKGRIPIPEPIKKLYPGFDYKLGRMKKNYFKKVGGHKWE